MQFLSILGKWKRVRTGPPITHTKKKSKSLLSLPIIEKREFFIIINDSEGKKRSKEDGLGRTFQQKSLLKADVTSSKRNY